jgi:hypothetical protein
MSLRDRGGFPPSAPLEDHARRCATSSWITQHAARCDERPGDIGRALAASR